MRVQDVPVFVLTLDPPHGPRRTSACEQMSQLGLPFAFVTGVEGDHRGIWNEYSPIRNFFFRKRPMTRGEIACYLGHRAIWRAFVENGAPFGLVFEDDFMIPQPASLRCAIEDCIARPGEWDLVKFFDFEPRRPILRKRIGSTEVIAHVTATGMVGYLLSRRTAQRLLTRQRVFRPVDEDVGHMWEFDLKVWSTFPNLLTEISCRLGGSYLASEREAVRSRRSNLRSAIGIALQAWRQARLRIHLSRMRTERG